MRSTLTGCVVLLALSGSSCTEGSQPTVTVADSAGIRVVTNLPGGLESAGVWTLSSAPLLEIGGGAEPEVPLFRVTAVTPLPSGSVAVGTSTPPQALVFEIAGTLLATLGREGEGPGEFLDVGSVVSLGSDSIAVWDPDRRRISVFNENGNFEREVDLSAIAPMSARGSTGTQKASGFTHLLPSASGSLILFGEAALGPGSEPVISRHEMPAYRIATDGSRLASFGFFPGMETSPGLATPFGARTHAVGSAGALVVGTSEATEYRMFAPGGDVVRIVRWQDHDRIVGGPFLSRWLEMTEAEPGLGEYIRAAPRAERFPAYDDLVATDSGEILVAEYPGPLGLMPLRRADPAPEAFKPSLRMPARNWLVFDSLGALKATLRTADGFEPYALHETMLWGVYTDELDVESVRAYGLRKR